MVSDYTGKGDSLPTQSRACGPIRRFWAGAAVLRYRPGRQALRRVRAARVRGEAGERPRHVFAEFLRRGGAESAGGEVASHAANGGTPT